MEQDPTKDLYNLSISKGILLPNTPFDEFNKTFNESNDSRLEYLNILKAKKVFRDDVSFNMFSTNFSPPNSNTIADTKQKIADIDAKSKKDMSLITDYTSTVDPTQEISQKRSKDIDTAIVDNGSILDMSPEQLSEIKYGDRDKNIVNNIKSATSTDKTLAKIAQGFRSVGSFIMHMGERTPVANMAIEANNALFKIDTAADTIELHTKQKQLAEYDNLLDAFLVKKQKEYGNPEALKQFVNIDNKLRSGENLSGEEQQFYKEQLQNIHDPSLLAAIDKKREIYSAMVGLPLQHTQAMLRQKLESAKQQDLDEGLQNPLVRLVYHLGNTIASVPGELAAKIYDTGLSLHGDVAALNLETNNSGVNWEMTSKEQRPFSEQASDVTYNGKKYTLAYSNNKLYNIYDDYGNVAKLDDDTRGKIVQESNRVNPNHELHTVHNYEGLAVQGMSSLADMVGTILLTGGEAGILSGLGVEAGGALLPHALELVPLMAQFTGTYAKQAISEGGIVDPDKVMSYGLAGAAMEYLTEQIFPNEGMIGQKIGGILSKSSKKFSAEMLGELISGKAPLKAGISHIGKELLEGTGKEVIEELLANEGQFYLNKVYNKHLGGHFENESPDNFDTILSTAISTVAATVLPVLFGAGANLKTHNSGYIREALFKSLQDQQQSEKVFESVKTTLKDPKDISNFNTFKTLYDSTKDKSADFITGTFKNASETVKKQIFHNNFEISRLEDKKDEESIKQKEELVLTNKELTLHTKYNVHDGHIIDPKYAGKEDALDKVDEILANKDLTKLRPSTIGKIYNTELSKILNNPTLEVKDLKTTIDQDKVDHFNNIVRTRIKELRDKFSLPEIESTLLNAEDLDVVPKAAKELYIKKAIKEQKLSENKQAKDKEITELKARKDRRQIISNTLQEGDVLKHKETGKEYTYKGIKEDPIIEDENGEPLQHIPGENISSQHLIETLPNYDIIKPPKPNPVVTNTGTAKGNTANNTTGNAKGNTKNTNTGNPEEEGAFSDEFQKHINDAPVDELKDGVLRTSNIRSKVDPDTNVEYTDYTDPHARSNSSSSIAFLGLPYMEDVSDSGNISDVTISNTVEEKAVEFLDPTKFTFGTMLEARVNDNDDIMVYDPTIRGNAEIRWGDLKKKLNPTVTTPSGLKLTFEDLVPIDLYKNGKRINGNIHTKAWVDKRAKPDAKENELLQISHLRSQIINNKNKDLVITDYNHGRLNISLDDMQSIPSDIPIVIERGKILVKTIENNIPVNLDYLNESEADTIISAIKTAFGIEVNKDIQKIVTANKDIKSNLESFIADVTFIEKPAGTSFTKIVQEKAKKKVDTVSIEVTRDTTDLEFSILFGKTYADNDKYTIIKYSRVNGKPNISILKKDGLIESDIETEDEYFGILKNNLLQKKIAYKLNKKEINILEDGKLVTHDYESYIRPRIMSNLVFTKVSNTYYSPYFQPHISLELVSNNGNVAATANVAPAKQIVIEEGDLFPFEEKIGSYLNDFVVTGVSDKLVNNISKAIIAPIYREFVRSKTNRSVESLLDEISLQSSTHKHLLENAEMGSTNLKNAKNSLLSEWNKIENNAKRLLFAELKDHIDNIEDLDDFTEEVHNDDKFLTQNSLEEASPQIRAFFNTIYDRTSLTGKLSIFGLGEKSDFFRFYHDVTDVINKVMYEIAISDSSFITPSWKEMEGRLLQSNLPFKLDFIEIANKDLDESKRNELVSVLFNSFKKMTLLEIRGDFVKTINISEENNYKKKLEEWMGNFANNGMVSIYQDEETEMSKIEFSNDYVRTIEELKALLIPKNKAERRSNEDKVKLLKPLLDKLGITLSENVYKDLSIGNFPQQIFGDLRGGLVHSIVAGLSQDVNTVERLFSDNMFARLAKHDMKVGLNRYSNSIISGNKLLQALGIPRNIELRMAQFIHGKLDYLKNTTFGKAFLWNRTSSYMSMETPPPDAMRNKKGNKTGGFENFTLRDHIIYRLKRFNATSSEGQHYMGNYVTSPMEDKKNPLIIKAPRVQFSKDGTVSSGHIGKTDVDLLISQVVVPELLRIKYETSDIEGYVPELYYMIPELNEHKDWIENAFIEERFEADLPTGNMDVENWFDNKDGHYDRLKTIMSNYTDKVVATEKAVWVKNGLYERDALGNFKYLPPYLASKEEVKEDWGLREYVVNYMVFHANEHLLTGDPAFYYKGKGLTIADVIASSKNKQKRLSLLNAPYKHIAEPKKIRVAAIEDPLFTSNTLEFLKQFVGADQIEKYKNKKGSDAQLLASGLNYIDTIFRMGKISTEERDRLSTLIKGQIKDIKQTGKISKENLISIKDLTTILHPLKTVLGSFKDEGTRERVMYVKMSEFPMIPQITLGSELEKIRRKMDDTNTDKLVFSTGFKVGSPKPGTIEHENAVISNINLNEENIVEFDELYYGEQSENPQDLSKYKVPHGNQRAKLEFLNILDEHFKHPVTGKMVKGSELLKLRDSYYEELQDLKLKNLYEEFTKDGALDMEKVIKVLKSDVEDFDPVHEYLLSEKTIKKAPLWSNPLFQKLVPKLSAIVEKRTVKPKVRGKSYVQAFSDFFKQNLDQMGIIPTENFSGELKSIRSEDGTVKSAQIFIPWNYKTDIAKVMKNGKIDFNKIDAKVLKSIGFRIPTSGHNSVTSLEVVGFLPQWMGNVIFLPSDLMVQMGSDLDFDKLYSLFYNVKETEDLSGAVHIMDSRDYNNLIDHVKSQIEGDEINDFLSEEDSDKIERLENNLLDISNTIYTSDNHILRSLNHNPIGYGELENLAKASKTEASPLLLSPSYNIGKYLSGRTGKIGIGSFSIDNTFHAALQGTKISYKTYNKNEFDTIQKAGGDTHIDGEGLTYALISLDRLKTHRGKYISEIYSAFQNASTDEGKEQLLQQLGITTDTFNAVRGMIQTGHDEFDIVDMIQSPIIEKLMSTLSEYGGLFGSYKDQQDLINEFIESASEKDKEILQKYNTFYSIGKALTGIRSIYNLDSKGFGGSPWTSIIKQNKIDNLYNNPNFTNLERLFLRDGQTTYIASTTNSAIEGLNLFYSDKLIPFKNKKIEDVIQSVLKLIPSRFKNSMQQESDVRNTIFKEWLKYFYSSLAPVLGVTNIREERQRLLITDPLSKKIAIIKKSSVANLKNNLFINILNSTTDKNLNVLKVYTSNVTTSLVDIQRAIIDLYQNSIDIPEIPGYTTKELVKDFYKYAFLVSQEQNPSSFLKYLPLDYIYDNPLFKDITVNSFANYADITLSEDYKSFVLQFFQHNNYLLQSVDESIITKTNGVYVSKIKSLANIVYYSPKKGANTVLVKINNMYFPIDSVGSHLNSQYDYTADKALTDVSKSKVFELPKNTVTGEEIELNLSELLKEENIINSGSDVVYKYLKKFQEINPNIRVFRSDTLPADGITYRNNDIYISSSLSSNRFYATLAHELIHTIDNSSTLNNEAKKIRLELEKIYTQIYDAQSWEFREKVQRLNDRKAKVKDFRLTKEELDNHYYAMSNSKEFLAFFTDADNGFRDWIDGVDLNRNNWRKKIEDFIKKLIAAITGSTKLSEVMDHHIFRLIDKTNNVPNVTKTTSTDDFVEQPINKEIKPNEVTKFFETKFNLPVEYDNTLSSNIGGYVKDGKVYLNPNINPDKLNEVIIEEYTHIITTKLEKEHPEIFEGLFNDLINTPEYEEIRNRAIAKVNSLYPELTKNEVEKLRNKGIEQQNQVNYALKSVSILQSPKADEIFRKGDKNNWNIDKILTELAVPKEQKQLILDLGITDRDEIVTSLLANYSYTIEVNTAKLGKSRFAERDEDGYYTDGDFIEGKEGENTQYYKNLVVPGGTNYTESEIATPLITPSIKGHAQFSTDNGIGWFRSDEVNHEKTEAEVAQYNKENPNQFSKYDGKTRRILEVQSDLFQKGRDRNELAQDKWVPWGKNPDTGKDMVIGEKDTNGNQFLQLLNKDNNWVTFFVKSIIQDSAKKGYEKVLFPSGNTASKVEGHTTLEEFKKQKEDRIISLEEDIVILNKDLQNPKKIDNEEYSTNLGTENIFEKDLQYFKAYVIDKIDNRKLEIKQLKQELERVEKEGFGALKPIYNFYENTVKNILKKNYSVKEITDEYGNAWNVVTITEKQRQELILLSKLTGEIDNSKTQLPAKITQSFKHEVLGQATTMVTKGKVSRDLAKIANDILKWIKDTLSKIGFRNVNTIKTFKDLKQVFEDNNIRIDLNQSTEIKPKIGKPDLYPQVNTDDTSTSKTTFQDNVIKVQNQLTQLPDCI